MADDGLYIEGWDEFVENFSKFVDNWEAKKEKLLIKMGNQYQREVMLTLEEGEHDDTSTLKNSFNVYVFGDKDYVEVGTNIHYALYLNDGHVQHKRLLPVTSLTAKGKRKKYNTIKGKDGVRYVTLRERYIPGVYYLEEARERCKPLWKSAGETFMKECAREIEGGSV